MAMERRTNTPGKVLTCYNLKSDPNRLSKAFFRTKCNTAYYINATVWKKPVEKKERPPKIRSRVQADAEYRLLPRNL